MPLRHTKNWNVGESGAKHQKSINQSHTKKDNFEQTITHQFVFLRHERLIDGTAVTINKR
jgi:hypothetical protein